MTANVFHQKRILVTGAAGFIGKSLVKKLGSLKYSVVGSTRSEDKSIDNILAEQLVVGDINHQTDWSSALKNVDCVFHLAGRAHKIGEIGCFDSLQRYFDINTAAALNLASQAASAGVKKFVFVSSIGVLGENSSNGIISNNSSLSPKNAYALSKANAEIGLKLMTQSTNMQIVILRPPLIYGAGAPGNFARLIGLIAKAPILPFGGFSQPRSMMAIENFCDLLSHIVGLEGDISGNYVLSDGSDWSTARLIALIAESMGKNITNLNIKPSILLKISHLFGRYDDLYKLQSPFLVDRSETCQFFNWSPPYDPIECLRKSVESYTIPSKLIDRGNQEKVV